MPPKEISTTKSFAGGEESLRDGMYKISCLNDLMHVQSRLFYEKRGTQYECLTKGYGRGATHINNDIYGHSSNKNDEQKLFDDPAAAAVINSKDEDGYLRTVEKSDILEGVVSKRAFEELDVDLENAFDDNDDDKKHDDDSPEIRFQRKQRDILTSNRMNLVDKDFTYASGIDFTTKEDKLIMNTDTHRLNNEIAAYVYELISRQFFFPQSMFFGLYNPLTFHTRKIEMLEESFSLRIIRETVFEQTEWVNMAQIMLNQGNLFFLLKGLTVDTAPIKNNIILCEVNFQQRKIIFYYSSNSIITANLNLDWYKRIFIQQFVMPLDANWKFLEVPLKSTQDDLSMLLMICYLRQTDHLAHIEHLSSLSNTHDRVGSWLATMYHLLI